MTFPAAPRSARRGVALVVAAATLFAINASVTTVVLGSGVSAADLTWWRCIGASVGLFVLLGLTRRASLRITRRELPLLTFYGIVGIVAVQFLYAVALDRLTVSLALLLEFTAPVLVALWARIVLREPVRARVWVALVLSLGGLCLVAQVWLGLHLDLIGTLAGLGAAVSLAVYWLVGEHAVNSATPRDALSLTFWGTTIGALSWFVIRFGSLPSVAGFGDVTSLSGRLGGVHLPVGLVVVWVCVLGTLVPFVLDVAALRHISATTVGLVGMLEPVGATLVAWLWLEQALSAAQVAGVVTVVIGISLAQTARSGPRNDAAGEFGRSVGGTPRHTVPPIPYLPEQATEALFERTNRADVETRGE